MENIIDKKIDVFFTQGAYYLAHEAPLYSFLLAITILLMISAIVFFWIKMPRKTKKDHYVALILLSMSVLGFMFVPFTYLKPSKVEILDEKAIVHYMLMPSREIMKIDVKELVAKRVQTSKEIRKFSSLEEHVIGHHCEVTLVLKDDSEIEFQFSQPNGKSNFCQRV